MARTGLNDATAAIVARLAGAVVTASDVVWERPHVVRATLDDGRTVIVKRPRDDADLRRSFERERAVLELLGGVPDSPAPAFVGADGDVVVMEDLPAGRSLAELLLGDDQEGARDGVVAFAVALGRLHASTVDLEHRFTASPSQPGWATLVDEGIEGVLTLASRFAPDLEAAMLSAEARAVGEELRADGWWRTLVHGDPCPDNTRIEDGPAGRFRLFDFETSAYGSCLLDASYLLAPFPTCWCFGRIPDELGAEALAAYRAVFGTVRPQALDDAAWDSALAAALASWFVARGNVIVGLLDGDREWGTTTVRVRVRQWLHAFLAVARRADRFPVLGDLAAVLADRLASAWPEAILGDYPALPTGAATVVVTPSWWRPGL